jgi:hypothetical protein
MEENGAEEEKDDHSWRNGDSKQPINRYFVYLIFSVK